MTSLTQNETRRGKTFSESNRSWTMTSLSQKKTGRRTKIFTGPGWRYSDTAGLSTDEKDELFRQRCAMVTSRI